MKKILLLACFALIATGVWGAEKPACEMVFTETECNFGRIAERGKAVSHVFEFTNEGTHPLVITRIVTTCKCTSYDFSKKPVPPGEKGRITVRYNPRKQEGMFYKVLQIYTNCEQGRMMLTIRGEVVK